MDSPSTLFTTPMRITLSLVSPAVGVVLLVAAGCSGSKVENTQPNLMFHLQRRSLSLVGPLGMGLVSTETKPPVVRFFRGTP